MKPLAIDLFCGLERRCAHCSDPLPEKCRSDKKFCSTSCYQRHFLNRPTFPYERKCKSCQTKFVVSQRADANRQYCSQACSKLAWRKGSVVWLRKHPEKRKEYSTARKKRNPEIWRDKARVQRQETLRLLGGKCLVCGVSNPSWLHVDYIPTCKNDRYRHSKTLRFISDNLTLFRLLCANHHYELTLTGKIEGTDVVQ